MSLRLASDDEKRARDRLTHAAWGQGLDVAQFLERERLLRSHPWCQLAMRTWLWTGPAGEVLASCETFECPSHVGGQRGRTWAVASVFVEPAARGRGHASALLTALVDRLREEDGAQAVVLFSEVGVDLYARIGFWPVPAFDTWFDASADAPAGVTWLQAPLPAVAQAPAATQVLRVTPSAAQLDWHLERERFYASASGRPRLEVHGARVQGSSIGWTAYYKSDELHVLWLDVVDPAHREPLVRAAQWAASQVHLPVVRVWETMSLVDVPGARRARRDDEIAMFAPLMPGVLGWTHVVRGLWV